MPLSNQDYRDMGMKRKAGLEFYLCPRCHIFGRPALNGIVAMRIVSKNRPTHYQAAISPDVDADDCDTIVALGVMSA